ncbi:MAG TPA: GTPase Era [Alphaproteobacteria bacterium]|nr:GTPase Era [Alphaproteobacteria bacterium]
MSTPYTEGAVVARRCGFIAVMGAPNSGKSTLVNRLVGAKVSIVSPKVQTTRTRVTGIALEGESQIVFLDLPGVFEARKRLDRAMVDAAWRGAADADQVLLLADATRAFDDKTRRIVEGIRSRGLVAVLAINKIDLVKPPSLLKLARSLNDAAAFAATFMISAATGDGVGDLKTYLARAVPAGPWLYPEDQISDMPERLLAAEITREQAFIQLRQELPYSIAVETEKWQELRDGSARIEQVVYVRRDNQRKIVLGEGGSRIKTIGAAARGEMVRSFGRNIHLFLHVKVAEDWAERRDFYRLWGLEYDA